MGANAATSFSKRTIKLPDNIEVEYCDIQDNLFAYCNRYEVGLIFLKGNPSLMLSSNGSFKEGLNQSMSNIEENEEQKGSDLTRVILKESFANIADFNVGQNLIIL
jgi:hypothetical protein